MKKTVSIVLTIILLFSTVAFQISATNVTDDDIAYFKSNIQRIKKYVIENGMDYNPTYGRKYRYIENTAKKSKLYETATILYYPDKDEIALEFSSTNVASGVDSSTVSLCDISYDKQAHFDYYKLLGSYSTRAHSAGFNMIDYQYSNPSELLYFDSIDNSPPQDASAEYSQTIANGFFELKYNALVRWHNLLNDLFGFKLQGIGLGASSDNHNLNKNGYCELCGRRFVDTSKCSCSCHKTDFLSKIITSFKMIFWMLFRIKQTCDCGIYHY